MTDNDSAVAADIVIIGVNDVPPKPAVRAGGGGGGTIIRQEISGVERIVTTFSASYFLANLLEKIKVSTSFINLNGTSISEVSEGQQIQISSMLQNRQEEAQTFAYILQVSDESGVVVDIGISKTVADAGRSAIVSRSWQPLQAGEYTIKGLHLG